MPRQSIGEIAMTGAERQARYRAARADGAPVIRVRRPTDRRSRIRRWNDTITALIDLQVEYADRLEDLPENRRDGPTRDCRTRSLRASGGRTAKGLRT